jgi:transcription termination factor Rho
MPVLSRDALEASPLADLHAIASELGIDGFRRLRKADLVGAILATSGGGDGDDGRETSGGADGDAAAPAAEDDGDREERPPRRRGGRTRGRKADEAAPAPAAEDEGDREERPARRRGGRREAPAADGEAAEPAVAEGVVELAGNGAAFLRVGEDGKPGEDDVYVSAAQVRRCELVDGDRVAGPVRRPRRTERYPSLVRVATINGTPAEEVAAGTPFDDLPATWPTERFELGSDDPTLKAIAWLTPLGRGSRATITGGARAGKSEALRRLAGALAGQEGIDVRAVLLGVRPEEAHAWREDGLPAPVAALTLTATGDAQSHALERAVDAAKRQVARGAHVVLLVDGLDGLHPPAARRALGAARSIPGGGSLTVVAVSTRPLGGETTVVALDPARAQTGRFPALDLAASGTLRPELLVGDAGAEEISKARAQA